MIRDRFRRLPAVICLFLMVGCGADVETDGVQSYKETKSMVIDILKSEEGQKAIQGASRQGGGGMQMMSAAQGQQLQAAVKQAVTDPRFGKQMETLMADPKIAGEVAKAVTKQNKQMHKDLMKDPEYRRMLLQVMKDPEYTKMLHDLMKSNAYRNYTMTIFKESLESPLFKAELVEIMKKAMEEQSKPKKKKGGGGS